MATKSIERVVESLESRADPGVDHDTLTAVVEADFRRYDSARIKDFIPLLVERDIRARLVHLRARTRAGLPR